MKKKFKDTKVGQLLAPVAPHIIDMVGDVFPPAKLLKALVDNEKSIPPNVAVDIDKALEDYDLEVLKIQSQDRASARAMYGLKNEKADHIASSVMKWNLPVVIALIGINVLAVMYLEAAVIAIIANVIGFALNSLLNERLTILQFFFGSSQGSKEKDEFKL